jgi:hypothetical protein
MYPTLYPQLQAQLHLSDKAFYVLGSALLCIVVLFMITEPQAYPAWILPTPIDPEKFGDYEDDDEDE